MDNKVDCLKSMDIKYPPEKDHSQLDHLESVAHREQESNPEDGLEGAAENLYSASTFRLERFLHVGFIADRHISSKIIHDMLVESGHHVDNFLDFKEAASKLITGKYDLILITRGKGEAAKRCDQLLSFVRKQEKPEICGMPLVVVTELNNAATLETLFLAGASDVIVKPISETELHNRLQQVIFLVPETVFEGRRKVKTSTPVASTPAKSNSSSLNNTESTENVFTRFLFLQISRTPSYQKLQAKGVLTKVERFLERGRQLGELLPFAVKLWHGVVLIILMIMLTVYFTADQNTKQGASSMRASNGSPALVSTITPELGDMVQKETLNGRVVSENKLAVRSQIAGSMESIFVKVGDQVFVNQVIAVMESKQAVSDLKIAQSRLDKARKSLQLEKARYQRALKQFRSGQIKQPRLNEVESLYDDAKLAQKNATDKFSVARANLKKLRIIAEFDGVISGVLVKKGKKVSAGDGLFNLVSSSNPIIEVDMNNRLQKPNLAVGDNIKVYTSKHANEEATWNEKIAAIEPVIDEFGMTSAWRVQITLRSKKLRYGQRVYVDLPTTKKKDVIKVHVDSIVTINTHHFVPVNVKGIVKYQQVKVGLQVGNFVEVEQGLDIEDAIIVSSELIDEGMKVRVN